MRSTSVSPGDDGMAVSLLLNLGYNNMMCKMQTCDIIHDSCTQEEEEEWIIVEL